MCASRLFEKAERLVASGRIESLGGGVYNVVGDHGTYTVVQDYSGKLVAVALVFCRKQGALMLRP